VRNPKGDAPQAKWETCAGCVSDFVSRITMKSKTCVRRVSDYNKIRDELWCRATRMPVGNRKNLGKMASCHLALLWAPRSMPCQHGIDQCLCHVIVVVKEEGAQIHIVGEEAIILRCWRQPVLRSMSPDVGEKTTSLAPSRRSARVGGRCKPPYPNDVTCSFNIKSNRI
jgi:hypothetical protein